jgi:DNA excision repair protein ERCC-4
MSARNRVVVDEREKPSGVPQLLRELGMMVDFRMLEVGDYIVPGYAVERKEIGDFLKSLYSHHVFDQAYRLREAYENPILVVEGDVAQITNYGIRPRAIWGALASLIFDYGLKVFFTPDQTQTANLIYTLRGKKPLSLTGPVIKRTRKAGALETIQLQLISCLPSVGLKLADRMLTRFQTARSVFSASTAELSTVRGVGKVTADKIVKVLDTPYRPFLKRPKQLKLDESSHEASKLLD